MSSQILTEQESAPLTTWVRLLRAHTSIRRTFNAQLQAEHGLTVNDYETLLHLSRAPDGLKRVLLAERLQLTPSGVTRLLDGLEAGGLVGKAHCDSDARITYAVLTEAGLDRLREASCSHVRAVETLFSELYEESELATLAELLRRLPGAAEADAGACTGH